ncbi:TPA: hypothetical protein DDW35_11800 [Candidatus Sumerlaeota bacterium]|jgi:metallo-beta-lactamase family protein|nr:hypothetical protein [Candidatus Sumerlaeota bacterium]
MRLRFLPASDATVGSNTLFEFDGFSFLIDCGLYRGMRGEAHILNTTCEFDPAHIHAALLTRATPPSVGNFPRLIKKGFAGSVYATPPTADQCNAIFRDLALTFAEETNWLPNGNGIPAPLYTTEEAETALNHITSVNFHRPFHLLRNLRCTFYQAGGMLGASLVALDAHTAEGEKRIVFANHIGCVEHPILHSPELTPNASILVLQTGPLSTETPYSAEAEKRLVETLRQAVERGGKILIPGDILGNALPVILALKRHKDDPLFAQLPIRSDSSFTENAAEALRRHHGMITPEARAHLLAEEDPFGFASIQYLRGKHHVKNILSQPGPALLIAPFEDCETGPALGHLAEFLQDERNLLFLSPDAPCTLAGKLLSGQKEVEAGGQHLHVTAEVVPLHQQSAPPDQIINYITLLHSSGPALEGIFLLPDSVESGELLSAAIEQETGIKPYIPDGGMEYEW